MGGRELPHIIDEFKLHQPNVGLVNNCISFKLGASEAPQQLVTLGDARRKLVRLFSSLFTFGPKNHLQHIFKRGKKLPK
jgi:hypothetical protein